MDFIFLEAHSINNFFPNQWEWHLASLHKTSAREVADKPTKNQCTQRHCMILKMCFGGGGGGGRQQSDV